MFPQNGISTDLFTGLSLATVAVKYTRSRLYIGLLFPSKTEITLVILSFNILYRYKHLDTIRYLEAYNDNYIDIHNNYRLYTYIR